MITKKTTEKELESSRLNLSAPWVIYYRMLEALFSKDADIEVEFDEMRPEVKLNVKNPIKVDALNRLLPNSKQYGSVTLKISVVMCPYGDRTDIDLLEDLFEGNEAVSYITKIVDPDMSNAANFVVFQKEVVQYFADNLGDVNKLNSTLYQDIAREVFGELPGIFFCTNNF